MTPQDRISRILEDNGLECEIRSFPESTKTSGEAADLLGIDVSEIAKSIVFRCGDSPVIVVASGINRVSKDKLGDITRSRPKIMGPDEVLEATGYPVGAVPPLGHKNIRVCIDRDLLQKERVWAAAGTSHSVFGIAPGDLVRVSGGEVADVKE